MRTVIIGQNGTGKSSLLQAIAIAAAGSLQVNTLAGRTVGHLRDRRTSNPLQIDADFEFVDGEEADRWHSSVPERHSVPLTLRSTASLGEGETSIRARAQYGRDAPKADGDPLDAARSRNTAHWFVAGYGVTRHLPDAGRSVTLDRPAIERMLPLFDATTALTSTNFSRYFGDDGPKSTMFHRVLKRAMLNVETLLPDIVDLELRGAGVVTKPGELLERDRFVQRVGRGELKVPGLALAHGYQSSIAWLADLVGHVLLEANEVVEPERMQGVVLVDEIDLYLHPVWQATLIPALRRTFPRMQFIVTTHSPVVLSGVAPHEVVRVASYGDEGDVVEVVHHPETGELVPAATLRGDGIRPDPRMMTGTELYREHFGLTDPTPNPLGDELRRYTTLANDPFRTEKEQQEMLRLRGLLAEGDIKDLPKPERRRKV
ncbi:MAG: ATP-binding protein [Polyangiales bacterium]